MTELTDTFDLPDKGEQCCRTANPYVTDRVFVVCSLQCSLHARIVMNTTNRASAIFFSVLSACHERYERITVCTSIRPCCIFWHLHQDYGDTSIEWTVQAKHVHILSGLCTHAASALCRETVTHIALVILPATYADHAGTNDCVGSIAELNMTPTYR